VNFDELLSKYESRDFDGACLFLMRGDIAVGRMICIADGEKRRR
jgi:hypothetical protein